MKRAFPKAPCARRPGHHFDEATKGRGASLLENGFENITAVLGLPFSLRRRLGTSNGIGRFNEEIRRRERVIRVFPSEGSLYRLLGALLMGIHDTGLSAKVYLDLTDYLSQREQATPFIS